MYCWPVFTRLDETYAHDQSLAEHCSACSPTFLLQVKSAWQVHLANPMKLLAIVCCLQKKPLLDLIHAALQGEINHQALRRGMTELKVGTSTHLWLAHPGLPDCSQK